MIKALLKGQYRSNRIIFKPSFLKIFETGKNLRVFRNLFRVLKEQYGANRCPWFLFYESLKQKRIFFLIESAK